MAPSILTNAADHYEALNLEAFRRRRGGASTGEGAEPLSRPIDPASSPSLALAGIAEDLLRCVAIVGLGVLLLGALNAVLGWWR